MVSFSLNKSVFIFFVTCIFLLHLLSYFLGIYLINLLGVCLLFYIVLWCYWSIFQTNSLQREKRTAHRGSAKKCSTQPATGILQLQVVVCHHAIFVWLLFCSSKIALFTVSKELFDVASYMMLLRRYITLLLHFSFAKFWV